MKSLIIIWIGLKAPKFIGFPVTCLEAKYKELPVFKSANDERYEK
jgi:hypothetical protein